MDQRNPLLEDNEEAGNDQTVGTGDAIPHRSEDKIIDDILGYLRKRESVCIQTERQSSRGWIREHDGRWQSVKQTNRGGLSASILEEEAARAILKANYYQLIPTTQAQTGTGREVWGAVEDEG